MWRRFTTMLSGDTIPQSLAFPEKHFHRNPFYNLSFPKTSLNHFDWLLTVAPCYPVKASNISIINDPSVFYKTLIDKCENAESRICLGSLYLGTGDLERQLVSVIDKKLKKQAGRIRFSVLLDDQRGSRGTVNSKSLLLPLIKKHKHVCKVSFYHTSYLGDIFNKMVPHRWNELIELQHMKIYLVDRTVIISGANLSNDYFTNRQDRYVVIEDEKLANFYSDLINEVQGFSIELKGPNKIKIPRGCPSPYKDRRERCVKYAKDKLEKYFCFRWEEQCDKGQSHVDSSDTWVMPLIQAGSLKVNIDSEATKRLLGEGLPGGKIRLATGYFNLTNEYAEALVKSCQSQCSLLMAHPNANGFKGAKGPAGGVPDAYSLLAKKFSEYVGMHNQFKRINLLEYERPGWTYHGKGLWYYLPGDSLPSLTLVGSPNFGERSVNRDLETQVAIVTTNLDLKKRLHEECEHLHQYAKEPEDLNQRKIPLWVQMTVGLFRNFF